MVPVSPPESLDAPLYRCRNLPTKFRNDVRRVLVTGASGYIGGRLVPDLITRGYQVRVLVRGDPAPFTALWPQAEVLAGDLLNPDSLTPALAGVDVAYYLVHSLVLGPGRFAEADLTAARNFRQAAETAGLRGIIYLGALGDRNPRRLAPHLRSRHRVADELRRGKVPVTVLRASIIIGSGSASFEIIHSLVQRLPVIPLPDWAFHRSQPIGIRDVIKYLVGVMESPGARGETLDIGGPAVMTYAEMMKTLARILDRNVHFFRCGPGSTRLFGYLMSLLTPVPAPITMCLAGGLRNDTVCTDAAARALVPFEPLPFAITIERALYREEQDHIATRWSNAYPPVGETMLRLSELRRPPRFRAHCSLVSQLPAAALFASICRIGGHEGWFQGNWMWRLRGAVDRLLFGVGTARGRRSLHELRINDVIDFWRVEDLVPDHRLLLRAEMRMPGRAWLEFTVTPAATHRELALTAHYATRSPWGHLYWRFFQPFHWYIFARLIKQIERRANAD